VVSTAPQGTTLPSVALLRRGVRDVTTDPEELDPEIDVELAGPSDDDDEDVDDAVDALPDGFVIESEDDDAASVDDDETDGGGEAPDATTASVAAAAEDPDDFEEEIAPVVRVPDEEDEAPARRTGEFVCSRCFLVKRESQLAVRSRKVCRDCA
jgi:hypothetical protein